MIPALWQNLGWYVAPIDGLGHLRICAKAGLVVSSWVLAYAALKHLPISVGAPIRATGPLWTLVGAMLIFGENPRWVQWGGIALVFAGYYAFAVAGKIDGIRFTRNRWIYAMLGATVLGGVSSLYDKYLIQNCGYSAATVQWWFAVYIMVVLTPWVLAWWWPRREENPFVWRWTIPLVGVLLIAADAAYFFALQDPEALVAILSALRRTSVIVSFVVGAWLFREVGLKRKAWALLLILFGVAAILTG